MEIKNAIIKSVSLSNADHDCLISSISLDISDGWWARFGGFLLYSSWQWDNKHPTGAGHWIWRCLEVLDKSDYVKLAGTPCRVKMKNGMVYALGNFMREDWFCPSEEFKDLK